METNTKSHSKSFRYYLTSAILMAFFVVLSVIAPNPAQKPQTASAAPGVWERVTPSVALSGGPGCDSYGTQTVAVDPLRASDIYAQFNCFGIWKSTNYGQTWSGPINTGTNGVTSRDCAGGITLAPGTPGAPIIYQACIRGAAMGFWRSLDGGVNWTRYTVTPTPSRQDYYPPAVDPYDVNHLIMPGHEMDPLVQSFDGGQTWSSINLSSGMSQGGGTAFLFFIDNGNATATRNTWLFIAQENVGTWRTTNGGSSWTKVSNLTHPHGLSQIYQPDKNGVVFMGGLNTSPWGVYRSTDYGVTWAHVGNNSAAAAVFGTPNRIYSMYSWACGSCTIGTNYQTAVPPGTSGWADSTPAGMAMGTAQAAVTYNGTSYIIVSSNWRDGLWRYEEPASGTPPAPTVTISANPTSITSGGSSTLTWSSTNATSCTASGGSTGWSGTKATSGTQSFSPTSTTTYSIVCSGTGGSSSTQSATVTVGSGTNNPPSVSISSPASGASVSGSSVIITANASDDVGVAGVQFRIDGANVGSEDTSAPYTYTWNSTTVSDGTHTISAVARDTNNQTTTSTSISITVANGGSSTSNVIVYDDQIRNSWSNSSWATVNLNDGPARTGTSAIGVTYNAYQALDFYNNSFNTAGYTSFDFYINSPTANPNLRAQVWDTAGTLGPTLPLSNYCNITSNTWVRCTVPISALVSGISPTIQHLAVHDYSGGSYPKMLFDDISILGSGSTTPAATATISANPTSITSGGSSTLTWSSTNATSCTSSGAWSGARGTSGTLSVSPTSTSTYSIVCSGTGGSSSTQSATVTVSTASAPNNFYTTNFPATENPISEGGVWTNGGTTGLGWQNVRTTTARAFGTQSGSSGVYDDSTAVLTGTWGNDQEASATIFNNVTAGNYYTEVELRLRSTVSANVNTGYEILFSTNPGNPYCEIVRWNGALGSFTYLRQLTGSQCAVVTGDVIRATIIGNTISVYKNGSTTALMTATDPSAFTSGSPGMGFWLRNNGSTGNPANYGFSSFTAQTISATPSPAVTLNANPTTITSGQSSTLTWSSTNATSCTSSGAWSGSRGTSGTLSVSPTSTSTYTLSCTGTGGTTNASATVSVGSTTSSAPVLYSPTLIQSPIDSTIVQKMRTIAQAGSGLRPQVFMKAGDSHTDYFPEGFMGCFNGTIGGTIQLDGRDYLTPTILYFRSVTLSDGTVPYTRDSVTAVSGWQAADALAGGNNSPLLQEYNALLPQFAIVMFGSNEIRVSSGGNLAAYEANMRTIVDSLIARGVIPILNTIPENRVHVDAPKWVPAYNGIVRAIAQGKQIPLIDLYLAEFPNPDNGLSNDNTHFTVNPNGSCQFYPGWSGLYFGHTTRNLITIEAMHRIKGVVVDNGAAPDTNPTRLSGSGTTASPFVAPSVPFGDMKNTNGASSSLNNYSCSGSAAGSGPEHVYSLTLSQPTPIRALLHDANTNSVNLYLLSGLSASNCVRSASHMIETTLNAGTHYFVVDSVSSSGGEYTFAITPCISSDTACATTSTTPTVNISANPTSIASGGSSTLTWSSTNATSCTSSGAWSGARGTSGTLSVSPTSTSTYTITCGSASSSATVTVGSVSTNLPPLPAGWPTTLQLGLKAEESSASAIRAVTNFGFRYQYLSEGVSSPNSWMNWGPGSGNFARDFISDSVSNGITPVFTLYVICQSGPSCSGNSEGDSVYSALQNTTTMTLYYNQFKTLMQKAGAFPNNKVVVHIEPDLFGYLNQRANQINPSNLDNAANVPAKVSSTGLTELAGLPENAAGFTQALTRLRDAYAPNVLLAHHFSTWQTGDDFLRSDPSDATVDSYGLRVGNFLNSLNTNYDMLFFDFTDRDGAFKEYIYGDTAGWFDANDLRRHRIFLNRVSSSANKRIVMWQIPEGNQKMRALNNVWNHFQNNHVEWLLDDPSRTHLNEYIQAGVIAFLFGRGADGATCACDQNNDGVTNPAAINYRNNTNSISSSLGASGSAPVLSGTTLTTPYAADDDGGFLKWKAWEYYQQGAISLSGGSTSTPTATISANPTTITSGGSSTLTWSSTNATSCTSSGAWSGSRGTSGTLSVSPTSTSTYTITCGTASSSATVTVTSGTNNPPVGTFDEIRLSDGVIRGWSYDPNATSTSNDIHIYIDGAAGAGGTLLTGITTNVLRSDVNGSFNITGNHGIEYTIPAQYRNGVQHSIYLYGIDLTNPASATLLTGSPRTFTLSASQSAIPFNGPHNIPGRLEAEDFDNGGEGVGYHDVETTNLGNSTYRATGVDLEVSGDTGGGANIAYARTGEWLSYTVNVTTTGTYNIAARVASNGNGGTFHLELDGTAVGGTQTIPNTNGWQTYATLNTNDVSLTSGSHVMRLVMDANSATTGAVGNFNYFDFSAASTTTPTATITANPTTITSGGSSTLTWSSTNATSCTSSGAWSGARGTSGTLSVSPTSTSTYTITCGTASSSATVTVSSTPAPTISSFSASPSSITSGGSSTLSWTVANATSLSLDQGIGTVTGTSRSVSPASTTTYTLTATNSSGSVTSIATVTVTSAPIPTISSFTASPTSIISGSSSTLSWTVSNATSLSINQGIGAVTGTTRSVSPTTTTTYTLTATNASGSVTSTATITVSVPPTVNISAAPTTINQGQSSTLTWSSTNATSCTASGAWSGSNGATSGTLSVSPTTTSTYTLTCTGPGGTTTPSSATVTVNALPPLDFTLGNSGNRSVNQGSSVTSTITSTLANGATAASISYTISGLPTGTTGTFSPTSCTPTCTTTLTINTTGSTPIGTSTLTVTGTGNSVSRTTTFALTVADATSPTVSITAPVNGSTVSGSTVAITATATDNIGVAGVQFRLDNANLGSEDTTAPYTATWDSTSATNTTHTLTAIARDSAGNITTSSTITLNVNNVVTPPPPPSAPNITNLGVNVKKGNATITWNTNISATSQVEYGTTSAYGSTSALSSSLVTSHTRTLTALNSGTYNFRAVSTASGVTGTSGNSTFIVRGKPPRPTGLTATAGSVILSWTNPTFDGFAGVAVLRSTTGFVNTYDPAFQIATTTSNGYTDTAVNGSTTYYYSIFVFDDQDNYSDPLTVQFTTPATVTPPPTPTPTPTPPVIPPALPPVIPPAAPGVVTAALYPSGTIFKYSNNATVYIKEGTIARPITDWSVYLNQVPATRSIITIPSTVTFTTGPVMGLRNATLIKASNNPTVYLIIDGEKFAFSSAQEFFDHNYNFSNVYVIDDVALVDRIPMSTKAFVRPSGTLFKYANSPAVYFLNTARLKRGYTTIEMFNIWNATLKDVITIPNTETYSDGPIATLPNGILVKGSSPTIYFVFDGVLRPFNNTSLFDAMGLKLDQVKTFKDSDLQLHTIGSAME
jgi:hypothetical protein